MKKINIYFIIIDSVSRKAYDGVARSFRKALGNLSFKSLIEQGNESKLYVTGAPTEFSYPSLTTSTYPLDYGGYLCGISKRPSSISKILANYGYKTYCFNEDFRPMASGYFDGYEVTKNLYAPFRYLDYLTCHLDFYRDIANYKKNNTSSNNERSKYIFDSTLLDMRNKLLSDEWRSYFKYSDQDVDLIDGIIARSINIPDGKNFWHFNQYSKTIKRLSKILSRGDYNFNIYVDKVYFLWYWAMHVFSISSISSLAKLKVHLYTMLIHFKSVFRNGFKHPDSKYIYNAVLNECTKNNGYQKNFFWIHTSDVHELFPACKFSKEKTIINYDINYKHGYSDIYIDSVVSSYQSVVEFAYEINKLKFNGSEECVNIFIVTSDHGSTKCGIDEVSKLNIALDFHHELYETPFEIFTDSDELIEKKRLLLKGLYSSVDIMPTLLDILNIPCDVDTRGVSIYRQVSKGRNYVLAEHNGPGPGDRLLKNDYLWVTDGVSSLSAIGGSNGLIFPDSCNKNSELYNIIYKRYNELRK